MLTSYIKNSYSISRYYHRFFLSGCEKERYYKYTLVLDNAFNTINKVDLLLSGKRNRKFLKSPGRHQSNIARFDHKFNVQDRSDNIITDLMRVNNNAGGGSGRR